MTGQPGCAWSNQVSGEPVAGEPRHLFQRTGLLEQVSGARYRDQTVLVAQLPRCSPDQFEDVGVGGAYDQQRWGADPGEDFACEVDSTASLHDRTHACRPLCRLLPLPCAKATRPSASGDSTSSASSIAFAAGMRIARDGRPCLRSGPVATSACLGVDRDPAQHRLQGHDSCRVVLSAAAPLSAPAARLAIRNCRP